MIYPVVRELAVDQIPVAVTCRVLRLAPSGYYDWMGRPLTGRDLEDAYLLNEIVDIYRASRGTYGAPRVHAKLKLGKGIGCGRKRVERLMRAAGLRGVTRRRLRGLTKRDRDALPSDDLVNRCFTAGAPRSSSTRCRWRSGAAPARSRAPSTTAITAASTPPGRSGSGCAPPGSWARWAASGIPS